MSIMWEWLFGNKKKDEKEDKWEKCPTCGTTWLMNDRGISEVHYDSSLGKYVCPNCFANNYIKV